MFKIYLSSLLKNKWRSIQSVQFILFVLVSSKTLKKKLVYDIQIPFCFLNNKFAILDF